MDSMQGAATRAGSLSSRLKGQNG